VEYLELRDNKPNILAIVFASNFPKNPIYDKYPIDITIDNLKGFDLVNGILIFDEEVSGYEALEYAFSKKNADFVIFVDNPIPLMSYHYEREILEKAIKYLPDYVYIENFIMGAYAPIFSKYILRLLHKNIKDIKSYVNKHINDFDVEVHFIDEDVRYLRLDFTLQDKYSYAIVSSLYKKLRAEWKVEELLAILEKEPYILKPFPRYIEIELTRKCNFDCVYCLRKVLDKKDSELEFSLYRKVIDWVEENEYEVVLGFGGYGEPFLYSRIKDAILEATKLDNVKQVIIETAGDFDDDVLYYLVSYDKVFLIISLPATTQKTYSLLRKTDEYIEKVSDMVMKAVSFLGKERVYVEFLRMKDNEDEIDEFYDIWHNKANIIIRDYNHYSYALEDKSIADLSPLDRFPCKKAERDLYIYADGSVFLCPNAIYDKNYKLGSLCDSSLVSLWQRSADLYSKIYKDFFALPHCKNCKIWYEVSF